MRPLGVTLIAALHWLRGLVYVAAGLALLGITHLSAHMISRGLAHPHDHEKAGGWPIRTTMKKAAPPVAF